MRGVLLACLGHHGLSVFLWVLILIRLLAAAVTDCSMRAKASQWVILIACLESRLHEITMVKVSMVENRIFLLKGRRFRPSPPSQLRPSPTVQREWKKGRTLPEGGKEGMLKTAFIDSLTKAPMPCRHGTVVLRQPVTPPPNTICVIIK